MIDNIKLIKCAIIGTGKIGIDLYFKLKKRGVSISIFNLRSNSEGARFCKSKKFNYFSGGIKKILKKNYDIVFDTTNAKSSVDHFKKLSEKNVVFVNLTPSKIGNYYIPYIDQKKKIKSKSFNLITCGAQSSIPIIYEISKKLNKVNYVEIVSAISSKSAGLATRTNIDEYLEITSKAVKKYTGIKNVKIILNINPGSPPVNMSNSIYIEINKKVSSVDKSNVLKIVNLMNKKMQNYAKGYKAKFIGKIDNKCLKITLSVTGDGDYLPKYSGNLDIITNVASCLVDTVELYKYEKNFNK